MIDIKKTDVWGFEGAIRGMRNPYMSHDNSDSNHQTTQELIENCEYDKCGMCIQCDCHVCEYFHIGKVDMELAKKLIKGGSEHRKFLRMIHVQADVLAPRYWWAEMDTYKYATMNSASTMHLITKRMLNIWDFSIEHLNEEDLEIFKGTIVNLNNMINDYEFGEASKDQPLMNYCLRTIKKLLPESYNQLRTIDTNYECLLNIYHQRKNHRLTEWFDFCEWVRELPYMGEFITV